MYAPMLNSARTAKRYDAGGFQVVLLTDIEAEGSIQYEYIVAVFEPDGDPCLFVTSERNDPDEAAAFLEDLRIDPEDGAGGDGESHFLCVFDESGHGNLGPSSDWADIGQFEQAALRIVAERFGETPRPVPFSSGGP